MKITAILSVIALSLPLACVAEQADDFWYVTVDIGQSSYEYSAGNLAGFVILDDDATAWGASAGYFLQPWLAIEAGYINHGSFSGSGTHCPPPAICIGAILPVNGDLSSLSFSAMPVWRLSDRVSLNGKIGVSRWDLSTSIPAPESDGTEFLYGGAVLLRLNQQLDLRAGFEIAGDRRSFLTGLRWSF